MVRSRFDASHSAALETTYDVFGLECIWTTAAGVRTCVRVLKDDEVLQQVTQRGTLEKERILKATVRRSEVTEPAEGDMLVFLDDDDEVTYEITMTPVLSQDGNEWQLEAAAATTTRLGGNDVVQRDA